MKRIILVLSVILVGLGFIGCAQEQSDYVSPIIGRLKYVPAGSFQRSDVSRNVSVISRPYRMSQYEITRSQFLDIMGTDPSDTELSSGQNDPVQRVNWYQAISFCNKLSLAEGLTPVYMVKGINFSSLTFAQIPTTDNETWDAAKKKWGANGYRLPTEMEWMWAAMGAPVDGQKGGTNTTGYLKAFAGHTESNHIDDYVWYYKNAGDQYLSTEWFGENFVEIIKANKVRTRPVGTKRANELDLYDMSGNIYEWCWDWFDRWGPSGDITGKVVDYQGPASGSSRVLRGGSWLDPESSCTVSYRAFGRGFSQPCFCIGFRVVRD